MTKLIVVFCDFANMPTKGTVIPLHAIKAYRWSTGVYICSLLTLALYGRGQLHTPDTLTLHKKPQQQLHTRLG